MPTPLAGDERETVRGFLNEQRSAVVRSVRGLDEQQARWRPCEGSNALVELVNHLAWIERWWFECVFSGAPDPLPDADSDITFRVPADQTVEETVDAYVAACRRSNEIFDGASMDDTVESEGEKVSLRWIALHMIEETARHAGHADMTRQLIDGHRAT